MRARLRVVLATGGNTATATGSSSGGGTINVSIVTPTAKVRGGVTASFDGTMPDVAVDAASLTVQARGRNKAYAEASVLAVGALATATGAVASAEVTNEADVDAFVGAAASIKTTGGITVDAQLVADGDGNKNYAKAWSHGGSGGTISAGEFVASAKIRGG